MTSSHEETAMDKECRLNESGPVLFNEQTGERLTYFLSWVLPLSTLRRWFWARS